MTSAHVFLILSVLLACGVEMVEAATVVLAVGTTRAWRGALTGVAAGLATLAVIVAVLGPAVSRIPLGALRAVVGGLLLVFGMTWLRKAILRAGGWKAIHDEVAIFAEQREVAKRAAIDGGAFDSYGFALCFKAVVLEGLEVVFIVLTFGSNARDIGLAVLGAALAVIVVLIVVAAVRAPLSRVPENTMKYAVGLMLVTFGTFWGAEGAGQRWPGGDLALLMLLALYLLATAGLVAGLRRHPRVRAAIAIDGPA